MKVVVMFASENLTTERRLFSFNSLKTWHFIATHGMWVKGSKVVREEFILVSSVSINDMASFLVAWIVWNHFLKDKMWLVHSKSDMDTGISFVDSELQ